ncbi:hypothetical protein RS130_07685 [Paraglaciecola aquimarina]|uniref:Uncharacterized protein n=1 Tax=Paraglaciecola aquimarina TaxID=1235557 RepID=A0ABU3SV09_9ALTE|nr:hypothetical protein [Paraglaciecola aquimarina]MDU0353823.1 hypothetical protein [Paraglaciecola aquimarina]
MNGVRFVDSLAEINTVAVKDTTVFVMIADQVAVINGAEVNDSNLHVNQIDLNDNLIGFLGVDQKFTATTLNISEGSTLAANQVFIDGSNLGFADITQMVSAYNLTLENSQMCLNCISVQ